MYEKYPCIDKDELNKREGEVIREIGTLNTRKYPQSTKVDTSKRYREKNRDVLKQKGQEYREKNKDIIKQKHEERKKIMITCECGREVRKLDISTHKRSKIHKELMGKTEDELKKEKKERDNKRMKEWREKNKEDVAKKRHEYYENNKDQITKKYRSKITCDCGAVVAYSNMPRHRDSKKHQEYLSSLDKE